MMSWTRRSARRYLKSVLADMEPNEMLVVMPISLFNYMVEHLPDLPEETITLVRNPHK